LACKINAKTRLLLYQHEDKRLQNLGACQFSRDSSHIAGKSIGGRRILKKAGSRVLFFVLAEHRRMFRGIELFNPRKRSFAIRANE
jgi:hypothetical protein